MAHFPVFCVLFSIAILPWIDLWAIFIYRGKLQDYLGLTCVFWNRRVLHKCYVTGTWSQAPEGSGVSEERFVVAGRASQILCSGAIWEQRESETQHITNCSHTPYDSDTSLYLKALNISEPLCFPTITALRVKFRPGDNGWRQHVTSKRWYALTIKHGVSTQRTTIWSVWITLHYIQLIYLS
jgi:hypothetical protein